MPDKVYDEIVLVGYPVNAPITYGYLAWGEAGYTEDAPHLGVDFGCPTGTQVISNIKNSCRVVGVHRVDANNVPLDGWGNGSFGNCVVLDVLNTRWYVIFCHLSRIDVVVGQVFELYTVLGLSGATGRVTGEHLHVQRSLSADFPKDKTFTQDPLLGLMQAEPQVVVTSGATLGDVEHSLNGLNGVVIQQGKSLNNLNDAVIAQNQVIAKLQAEQQADAQFWLGIAQQIKARYGGV